MSIMTALKLCIVAPLACLVVACSADAQPEPEQTTTPPSVLGAPASETPERTGTATSALSDDNCCRIIDGTKICRTDWCVDGPTPVPML